MKIALEKSNKERETTIKVQIHYSLFNEKASQELEEIRLEKDSLKHQNEQLQLEIESLKSATSDETTKRLSFDSSGGDSSRKRLLLELVISFWNVELTISSNKSWKKRQGNCSNKKMKTGP